MWILLIFLATGVCSKTLLEDANMHQCKKTPIHYESLEFGRVTFIDIDAFKGRNVISLSYECIDGYKLIGPQEVTCAPDGDWIDDKPKCEPILCPNLAISYGQINCTNSNQLNSSCTVTCDEKYELKEKSHNTALCLDTSMWDTTLSRCIPKTCDKSYIYIHSGYATCSASNNIDSVCEYKCNHGFILIGQNQTKCVDNNSTFEWDSSMPICTDAICPAENIRLKNGYVSCQGADVNNFLGSKCSYTCSLGYYLNGAESTRCDDNNTWTDTKPTCEERICPLDYLEITNGKVECYGPAIRNWYNSDCHYKCHEGYNLVGDFHAKCTNESKWNVDKPKCEIRKCSAPNKVNGGSYNCTSSNYEYQTVCNLKCYEGFELKGNEIISCKSNTAWTEPGECAEITCTEDYLRLSNGFFECSGADKSNLYNSRCNFACDSGYVLNGPQSVTCQLNGEWSNTKPVCEARFCSYDYVKIENGEVECFGQQEKNRYGSNCHFSCNKGYALVGNSTSLCESNGMWSSPKPICSVKICGPPMVLKNGHYICNSTSYQYQTSCNLTCNEGYFVEEASNINCNEDAGWTQHGACIAVSCEKNNTELNKGNVVCEGADLYNVYGSRCTYSCYAGYVLNGTTNATCNSDGRWSDEKPVCEGRSCSNDYLTIDNGYVNCRGAVAENMYSSTCFYSCVEGYELIGNSSVTCGIDEEWIGLKPKCQEFLCPAIPKLDEGEYICNTTIYKYETTCQLSCKEGYEVADAANITCLVNKEWSSPGRCIDIQKPIFPSGCPKNLEISTEKLGLQTFVQYQYPDVIDNAGSEFVNVKGNPEPGTAFTVGTTKVTVTATDKTGNVGECDFNVTVLQSMCEKPNIDITGQDKISYSCPNKFVYGANCEVSCTDGTQITGPNKITCNKQADGSFTWGSDGSTLPYCETKKCKKLRQPKHGKLVCDSRGTDAEICSIVCNFKFSLPFRAIQQYTCSKTKGFWSPSSFTANCFPRRLPSYVRMRPTMYYTVNSCQVDKENATSTIISSTSDFQTIKNLCLENEKSCNVTEIVFAEMQATEDESTCELKITLEIDFGKYVEKENPSHALEEYEVLISSVNDLVMAEAEAGKFEFPDIGVFNTVDYAELEFVCDAGESMVYETMSCAGCGPGSYYDNTTNICAICPYGTYQDQLVSFACILCPNGTTTKINAAISKDDCQSPCNPGEVSDNGKAPCEKCPVGTYQPDIGKRRCIRCPFGMSTTLDGQTHIESCQFFEFLLSETNLVVLANENKHFNEFTFMTWLHNMTIAENVTESVSAKLTIDSFEIYLAPAVISDQKKTREWNHLALAYKDGNITLYVNGFHLENYSTIAVDLLTSNSIRLKKATEVEVKVSGIQLLAKFYTHSEIRDFAQRCFQKADQLLLVQNPFTQTKYLTSSCKVGCGDNYFYDPETMLCVKCMEGYYRVEDVTDTCLECPQNNSVELTSAAQKACQAIRAETSLKETEIISNSTETTYLTNGNETRKFTNTNDTYGGLYNETVEPQELLTSETDSPQNSSRKFLN